MGWYSSSRTLAILSPLVIAALAGCQTREHYAYQLNAIPVPAAVLLKALPEPDCAVPAYAASQEVVPERGGPKSAEAKPATKKTAEKAPAAGEQSDDSAPDLDAARANKESGLADTPSESVRKHAAPGHGIDQLRRARDCYRHAENRARARLHRLQDSTAETIGALRNVKHAL